MNPALIFFLAGAAVGIFGGRWKPLQFLQPHAPVVALQKAQAERDVAQAAAARAQSERDAALSTERAKLEEQVRWSQQMTSGAQQALARVPPASKTPEVSLANDLLLRANVGLAQAIGSLPADKQAEILTIVNGALSSVQAERDAARAALAKKDAEFSVVTAEREAVKAEIPKLTSQVQQTQAVVAAKQAAVNSLTSKVAEVASKLEAKAREAGSFAGALDHLWHVILWVAGAWAFLVFVLPGLVKHLGSGPVKNGLRAVSGYLTSPLLFHDARTKLSALTPNPKNP